MVVSFEAYIRYNALRTYLSTFVEGMKNNVDENSFIHPEFMQCTATGRLSSRNPNFQNMPRGQRSLFGRWWKADIPTKYS